MMHEIVLRRFIPALLLFLFFAPVTPARAQSSLPCSSCHKPEKSDWLAGRHSKTQADIAGELAASWMGQTPDSVINGSQAEDCLACHSPTSVTTNGGMTEIQTIGHYFTTTGGVFTDSTQPADTAHWPHVWCTSCHGVPSNHPTGLPGLAIFRSDTKQYDSILTSPMLCGQCHGTLRFADTDHRIYNAWKMSRHGHRGQADVASELASSWSGKTPNDVINGPDAENCIACHSPTAVKPKFGDTTEVMVLSRFFTTAGGTFTDSTSPADTTHWSDVACNACHNPHHPDTLSYYNSTTRTYQVMASSEQLCGQCHGNLRFPGTDHLSYNIEQGTGGVGVPDQISMPGTECVSCHMHKGAVDGTNSLMFKGHNWSIFVNELDGSVSASCTSCHPDMNADSARGTITRLKAEFATLDSLANIAVLAADNYMQGRTDSIKSGYLAEAHHNLSYAESDESGGFHNHLYALALINDVIAKATLVVTGVKDQPSKLPRAYALNQNYPNPFNPATTIQYALPAESHVTIRIYNIMGQTVATLIDGVQRAGYQSIDWNAGGTPSGVYFYRMEAVSVSGQGKHFTNVRKMVLVR